MKTITNKKTVSFFAHCAKFLMTLIIVCLTCYNLKAQTAIYGNSSGSLYSTTIGAANTAQLDDIPIANSSLGGATTLYVNKYSIVCYRSTTGTKIFTFYYASMDGTGTPNTPTGFATSTLTGIGANIVTGGTGTATLFSVPLNTTAYSGYSTFAFGESCNNANGGPYLCTPATSGTTPTSSFNDGNKIWQWTAGGGITGPYNYGSTQPPYATYYIQIFGNAVTNTALSSTVCAGTTQTLTFFAAGSWNAGNVFTAQLSNAAGSFSSPITIGTVTSTTSGSQTMSVTIPSGTVTGSGYLIRVNPSNPSGITGEPTPTAITINNNFPTVTTGSASNVTPTSATISGTINTVGCASAITGYGFKYSNTNGFNPATTGTLVVGNNLVGGIGAFSNNLTGLAAGTYYYVAFATNSAGTVYGTQNSFTLCSPPTTQSSGFTASSVGLTSMTINWTRGNGDDVLIVARAASAISADPTTGPTYTPNTIYGSGTALGGGFVVYNGTGTSTTITGLTAGVNYFFSFYEYTSSSQCYLTPNYTNSQSTNLACAITPVPANNASGICYVGSGTLTSLSWAAVSNATSYDVYFGVNGSLPGTPNATVATNSWSGVPALSANTTYGWYVIAKNAFGGAAAGCATNTFTTNSGPCFCTNPVYSLAVSNGCAGTTSGDYIGNVTFAGINNTTGCNAATSPYYTYFSAITANVTQSGTFPVSVSATASGAAFQLFKVYIDFNNNGSFDDAGEMVYTSGFISTATNSTSGNISIPANAPLGTHRLRVRSTNPLSSNINANSCSDDGYIGEVEDYNVIVAIAPACSGTPSPGATIASAALACSTTTINLSLQNATSGTGVTYQWQSSPTIAFSSPTNLGTSATQNTTQTVTSYYRCIVTCSGNSGTSTPVLVTSTTPCVCTTPTTGSNGCSLGLYINNFTFAGINNTSGCFNPIPYINPYYSYFQGLTAAVAQNQTYSISISTPTNAGNYSQYFRAWIDYNDNGSFEDAGELVFDGGSINTGTNVSTGNVTISPTANPGTHLMRIRSGNVTTGMNSCSDNSVSGETEDYMVAVVQCSVAPTALVGATSLCTSGTATLTQTGGSLGTNAYWQWYQDANYTVPVGGQLSTANASITVSPTVTTTYYLRAEGNSGPCGAITAGPSTGVTITVNTPSVAPTTLNGATSYCVSGTATLSQTGGSLGTGAYWQWYSDAGYTVTVGAQLSSANASLTVSPSSTTTFYLRAEGTSAPCSATLAGPSIGVTVTVNVSPTGSASNNVPICSGTQTNIALSASVSGSSFTWTGAQQSGATVNGGSSGSGTSIQQTLTNAGNSINGVYRYTVTPTSPSGCVGTPFIVDVTVKPTPIGASSGDETICSGDVTTVTFSSSTGASTYTWTSAASAGVTGNSDCSATCGNGIAQSLSNSGTTDGTVTYSIVPTAASCVGSAFTYIATVGATPVVSASNTTIYSGAAANVAITSTVSNTDITWSQVVISGSATGSADCPGGCGNTITDVLINTGTVDAVVQYTISSATQNGCPGADVVIDVTVKALPTITCPATANLNSDAGMCTSSASIGSPSVTGTSTTVSHSPAGPYSLGSNIITWTATDGGGNTATCTQTVIVTDNQNPTIATNSNITVSNDAGVCSAVVTFASPTATDNCSVSSVVCTPASGSTFASGSTTVTCVATDAAGNTASSTFIVTVSDTQPPTISGLSTVTATTNTGCTATGVNLGTPITADNCSVASVSNNAPTAFPLGNTTVIWTVTDAAGNTTTATQLVVVTDNVNPTITAPAAVNTTTNSGCTATGVNLGTPITADNCSVASVTNNAPTVFPLGNTTVIWTVTDGGGNTATATQIVTVADNVNPTIIPPATINATTNAGCFATGVNLGNPTTADNCTVASTSNNAPTTFPLGNTTVTWTVTDAAGNTTTATQLVIVTDNVNPTITAPAAVTVCSGSTVNLGTPTTADNCGVLSVTNNAPSTYPTGTTTVTWTVTDNSGNTATATQIVTVNASPVGSAANIVICNGDPSNVILNSTISGSTFAWTSAVTVGSVIGNGSCTSNCGTTIADVLTNLGSIHGVVEYTVTPTSPAGCVGAPFVVDVTVGAAPAAPVISGPSVVCLITNTTYSCAIVPEATTYTWTVPTGVTGMTINSGQGTTAINVTISAGTVIGNVTCTASNNCGNSTTTSMAVTKKPAQPGAITGPTSICGQSTATYSIAAVFGATSYAWTLPAGMTIISGTGTTSITVSVSTSFIYGLVKVSAVNACGNVPATNLAVYGNVPGTPVSISGPTAVCGLTTATYTTPLVSGATGYQWTITGAGSISGSSTGSTVTVILNGTTGGTIAVAATNVCGQGSFRSMNLSSTPAAPGVITGPTILCGLTTACYSVTPLAGMTYTWTTPNGVTIPTGGGQGTSSICVQFGTLFQNAASGAITVTATSQCGTSTASNLVISQVQAPGFPSGPTVTTVGGVTSSNVTGLSSTTYSITPITGALDYIWSVATVSGGAIKILNSVGQLVTADTTTSAQITVVFTGTSGIYTGHGSVSVRAQYSCVARTTNTSAPKTVPISGSALRPIGMENNGMFSGIYPNPTTNEFMIDVTSDVDKDIVIEVYDVLGNKVVEQKHTIVSGDSSLKTNIEEFETGMYFVRLRDNDGNLLFTQRVIKQ